MQITHNYSFHISSEKWVIAEEWLPSYPAAAAFLPSGASFPMPPMALRFPQGSVSGWPSLVNSMKEKSEDCGSSLSLVST